MGSKRIFYGWVIVAASFVQLTVTSGLVFYGLPVYLRTLHDVRGFSISALSLATAVFWVSNGLAGVLVAKRLARIDPRVFVFGGGVVASGCIVVLGRVTALWQVFPTYAVFGASYSCTAVLIANTLVTRFFHQRRSLALSIASTGLSVGGIVLTPLAADWLSHMDIAPAMNRIALWQIVGILVVPLALLRPSPESMGLAPDGRAVDGNARTTRQPGVDFEKAVKTATFVAITIGFMLAMLSQVGGISHLVKLATERAGKGVGNSVVSVLAFFSVCGRLVAGSLVQGRSTRKFALAAISAQITGLLMLAFAASSAAVYAGAVVLGLGLGNVLLLHPLLIAETFGVREYPRIYSRSQMFVATAIAFGPLTMGWVHDHAGGYRTAYVMSVVTGGLGLAVLALKAESTPELRRLAEI